MSYIYIYDMKIDVKLSGRTKGGSRSEERKGKVWRECSPSILYTYVKMNLPK